MVVGSGREKSSIRKQQIIRMVKMPIMVANVGVSIFWMMRDIILNIFEVLVWMYFLKCGFVSNSVAKVCIVSGRGWWLCGERVFGVLCVVLVGVGEVFLPGFLLQMLGRARRAIPSKIPAMPVIVGVSL